ncbi:MAG: hypothetical protein V1782_09430 [Pseudomonadota bacterium]
MPYRMTAMAAPLSLKNLHRLLVPALCLLGVNALLGAAPCVAGIYTSSAHGNSSTGVNRTGLNNATSVDYAIGNCAHCHEQHASVQGSEPDPQGGPDRYLGMDPEENLCTHCHGLPAGNGAGGLPDDIKTDIAKTGGRHSMVISDSAHQADETQSHITNNLHVECTDCHNPHAAGKTLHTKGLAAGNEIGAASPLYKATGVVPTFSGANWTAPTYSAVQTATKEYQVCFKCHSGAVGNPATWSGTSGATAWTDVGLEFSPGNKSGHPVVTGLNNYTNSVAPKALAASQLLAPWNVNMGTQTMYCSDCHASDSSVAGPHGSTIKWMLAGTNKAWPYNTHPYNGTSGAGGTYWTVTFATQNPTKPFCWNCHPDTKASGANNAHSTGQHGAQACVTCHIRVPHGGKVSRLIAADDFAIFTNLPSRYTADGNGLNSSGTTASRMQKYTKKATPNSYGDVDCKATCASGPPPSHTMNATGTEYW